MTGSSRSTNGGSSIIVAFVILTSFISFVIVICQAQEQQHQQQKQQEQPTIDDLTFKAIKTLHKKLDVDDDGEVDDLESKKFIESSKTEAGQNHDNSRNTASQKLSYLHQDGKDKSISVDELWDAWRKSQVHNWTTDETVYWLANYVELPEYSQLFEQSSLNGTILPRLATDLQFLHKLGITDPSAKKRISIKAMDVVLFGPPKMGNSSKTRDIIVSIVILTAISACTIFYKRSIASQRALQAMQENLESMQELQQELDKALMAREAVATENKNLEHQLLMQRQFSASSNLSEQSRVSSPGSKQNSNGDMISKQDAAYVAKLKDEVKSLRKELADTQSAIEAKKFRASVPLQDLLRLTYNSESQYYNEKKLNLESKATEVKLRNQKLQKKKTSFLGYYKLAQENSLEEENNTIVEVKEAIKQFTKEIKEREERWRTIEELCGCTLDLPPMK